MECRFSAQHPDSDPDVVAHHQPAVERPTGGWNRWSSPTGSVPIGRPVPRQPAAGPARRRPAARSRAGRSRRALLRSPRVRDGLDVGAARAGAASGAAVLFSSHQLGVVEHLCEDVVDGGRVVLQGRLDDIRDAFPHRYLDYLDVGAAGDLRALLDVDRISAVVHVGGRAAGPTPARGISGPRAATRRMLRSSGRSRSSRLTPARFRTSGARRRTRRCDAARRGPTVRRGRSARRTSRSPRNERVVVTGGSRGRRGTSAWRPGTP